MNHFPERILVCGVGSIGERHLRNLLRIGAENIAVHRSRGLPYRSLDREFPAFADLDQALQDFRPDVVFITNPSALHLPTALAAARAGAHLFIEKPAAVSLDGLDELKSTLAAQGRHAMVAYMLRFHPHLQRIKNWIETREFGNPVYLRSIWAEHLPDWHPWEDYRTGYAARADLGGGPALTLSHDLDTALWLLDDEPTDIQVLRAHNSPLELQCEHSADYLLRFSRGAAANLRLDYMQRPPQRRLELLLEGARLELDYLSNELRLWRARIGRQPPPEGAGLPEEERFDLPDFDRNDLFVREIEYFFAMLRSDQSPEPGLAAGEKVLRAALQGANGIGSSHDA